jgi:hypothetical protein
MIQLPLRFLDTQKPLLNLGFWTLVGSLHVEDNLLAGLASRKEKLTESLCRAGNPVTPGKRHKYVTWNEQSASCARTFVTQQQLGKRHKYVTRNEQELVSDSKSLQIIETLVSCWPRSTDRVAYEVQ